MKQIVLGLIFSLSLISFAEEDEPTAVEPATEEVVAVVPSAVDLFTDGLETQVNALTSSADQGFEGLSGEVSQDASNAATDLDLAQEFGQGGSRYQDFCMHVQNDDQCFGFDDSATELMQETKAVLFQKIAEVRAVATPISNLGPTLTAEVTALNARKASLIAKVSARKNETLIWKGLGAITPAESDRIIALLDKVAAALSNAIATNINDISNSKTEMLSKASASLTSCTSAESKLNATPTDLDGARTHVLNALNEIGESGRTGKKGLSLISSASGAMDVVDAVLKLVEVDLPKVINL